MDWSRLRYVSHSKGKLYLAHCRYIAEPTDENLTLLLDAIVPLIHWVIDDGFGWIKDSDREDIISEVLLRMSGRLDYYAGRPRSVFSSMMWITVRRMVIDYLRSHDLRDIADSIPRAKAAEITLKSQSSVPRQVDAKLILEDLPNQVASFALSRDRFGFGARVLAVVVSLMIKGDKVPESLLSNWYHVANPKVCISFVRLMCRWFMYQYRYKFHDLVNERSHEVIDEVGRRLLVGE
jgi:DNA-directed RNA polymerase specialized sigma24 family protein